MLVGGIGLIVFFYISLSVGIYDVSLQQLIDAFLRRNVSENIDLVIFHFRLPRVILAGLIGLGLGIAGGVLQGITKNGLADPGILGINSGAGAAIVVFMFFFQGYVSSTSWLFTLTMPIYGLVGGLAAALIIYLISWEQGRLDPQRLLLTGIAAGAGFGAFTIFLSLKMKAQDFEMATVWLSGSIYSANWMFVLAVIPWFLICVPVIMRRTYMLDLFRMSEESLISIGVSVEKEKSILLLSSIGLISACVSVAGSISFVGLMAPHMARLIVGNEHKNIMPVCGLIGMLLVIGSDFIARTVVAPAEIPVGIVIAIIGVPYFVYLLFKVRM
ncbi:FecCD family ABC transporter permease [Salipaludibacillus agaradhaerens]|uniref:FecCD family ABC transporter permease n=1 Tax=Salipaludibacillus agaradhaerens TaxID=76935 RepID=UPI0009960897|nr:iron ABC transporter permease [Salipaludibacillus agaradhaerens]